jgi:hypothetical protein
MNGSLFQFSLFLHLFSRSVSTVMGASEQFQVPCPDDMVSDPELESLLLEDGTYKGGMDPRPRINTAMRRSNLAGD